MRLNILALQESTWRKSHVEAPRREIVLPRAAYIVAAILLGGYVVYWLRDVLTPIFLAFSIAYILARLCPITQHSRALQ
jgi:predicted PurR-regulated permease PerM